MPTELNVKQLSTIENAVIKCLEENKELLSDADKIKLELIKQNYAD